MIHAKVSELRKAYSRHLSLYKNVSVSNASIITQNLILCYAVECGLKCLIMQRYRIGTTEHLFNHVDLEYLYNSPHNLTLMLKTAKCPRKLHNLPAITTKSNANVDCSRYHEVWRYGIEIQNEKLERNIVEILKDITYWLDEQIR